MSAPFGLETTMVVAARYAVGIAAAFSLVLYFGHPAHSQDASPAGILRVAKNEAGTERGPGNCGTEMKIEAARQRRNFAGAPYPQNDPCGSIGPPVARFSSEDERIQRALL